MDIIKKFVNHKGNTNLVGSNEYIMKNDLLYKLRSKLIPKLIIPKSVAYQVVEYLHVQLMHQGRNKLEKMIDV